jgi:hypothetical protein
MDRNERPAEAYMDFPPGGCQGAALFQLGIFRAFYLMSAEVATLEICNRFFR